MRSEYAPAKLILIGEYAVLQGSPALVIAINRFCRVSSVYSPAEISDLSAETLGLNRIPFRVDENRRTIRFPDGVGETTRHTLRFFVAACESALEYYPDCLARPVSITIDTSDFFLKGTSVKLGLGSSAAMTVAMLKALLKERNDNKSCRPGIDSALLFRLAFAAHRRAQQKIGSGVDIAASAYGGCVEYHPQSGPDHAGVRIEPRSLPDELLMRFIWTGHPASTTGLVNQVNRYMLLEPEAYRRIIGQMTTVSASACAAIRTGKTANFLNAVSRYCELMAGLGAASGAPIMSSGHSTIQRIIERAGGVYKPSGAGGGDFGILFSDNNDTIRQCMDDLSEAGFDTLELQMAK